VTELTPAKFAFYIRAGVKFFSFTQSRAGSAVKAKLCPRDMQIFEMTSHISSAMFVGEVLTVQCTSPFLSFLSRSIGKP